MMKKLIAMLLALVMVLSMAACGKNPTESTNPSTQGTQGTQPSGNADVTPDVSAETLGGKLWAAFEAAQTQSPSVTAEEMANILATNENIQFMCGAMPIEPGFLSGFDNYEVKGFKSGAVFMPMIGSIAFVGYVFELEAGADANAFVDELTANANLRWNICVAAEEMVTAVEGNMVFFCMSPLSFEG